MKSKPLEIITSNVASMAMEDIAKYPHPDRDAERLLPYPKVHHKPKFSVPRDGKIFAIGSCFAREIEKAMFAIGMNVQSYHDSPDAFGGIFRFITNKYTPPSILHDLKLATNGYTDKDISDSVVQVNASGKRFANYQFGGGDALKTDTRENVEGAYRNLLNNLSKVTECQLVVITLGLIEAWYDKESETYLNIGPHKSTLRQNPERFELHVLSYEQITEFLEDIYRVLRSNSKVEQNLLITVSPVPLHATYRDQDVIQANCYSKSVLRASVEEFVTRHKEVAYFPSYEMVTLADTSIAWNGVDFRHVSPNMISKIMDASVGNYLENKVPSKGNLQDLIAAKLYKEVIELVGSSEISEHRTRGYAYYYLGVAYWCTNNFEKCQENIDILLRLQPQHLAAILLRAKLMVRDGKTKEAISLLEGIEGQHSAADRYCEALKV